MLFLVISTPRPERPSDVAAARQTFWPWIEAYREKKVCRHIYPRIGRGAVAVFDVESNNDLHRILNEWADIIPAHFDTYPLVDTQATAQLLAAQMAAKNNRYPQMTPRPVPILDGHNDVLLRLYRKENAARAFVDGDGKGQLDLPRARAGGLAGGMFAIFVPSPQRKRAEGEAPPPSDDARAAAGEIVATPPPPDIVSAQQATLAMASLLFRIERESDGKVRVCRSVADIEQCIDSGVLAPVLHIEGAEAIDENFQFLDVMHQAGLRSLGPVWSRSNIFGHGVPFSFPSSPDTGPGLTDAGKALIRACNGLKIMVDLSHLNEKGFWDVAAISDAPLVATHSNAHAICGHSRNLTDKQLAAIKDTGGMVGVNYAVNFLRPDGKRDEDTPLAQVVDHIDHLIRHVGEDGVGLGSDFDGAMIPKQIGTAAGLPNLVEEMRARQYGEALIEKICFRNWLRVLKKTWS